MRSVWIFLLGDYKGEMLGDKWVNDLGAHKRTQGFEEMLELSNTYGGVRPIGGT